MPPSVASSSSPSRPRGTWPIRSEARGTDWGHYLLYADEVAAQRHVLIDDPFARQPDRVFADPTAVGALYGSLRLVDGISSWSLTSGIVVVSVLAVASLALACLVVGQTWRLHVSYDYQRVVYYLGVGLVLLVGAAFLWQGARRWWIAAVVLVLVALARSSVGLRLPERVVEFAPRDPAVTGLVSFRERLDSGALPDTTAIVTDGCLHFAVPYLVRRTTLPAFSERQVGFVDRMPLAREAATILAGGARGRVAARRLGVGYAVGDPACVPDLASRLGGTTVIANSGVVVVRLPGLR